MAVTKASSKTESWTIRVPNDLATAVRAKFSSETGNTQIVIESIKHLLGIDPSLPNNTSNDDLTEIKLELDEVKSRLSVLEQNIIFNKSATSPSSPTLVAIDQEWMNLSTVADRLKVLPKSISGASSRRGTDIGDGIIKFDMSGRTIYKKGSGLKATYQLQ